MSLNLMLFLLPLVMSVKLGKYIYVEQQMDWLGAQKYCRMFYTDLAPINNEYDTNLLRRLAGNTTRYIWFRLMRNTTDLKKWMWSGGGEITTFFWATGQPGTTEYYRVPDNYMWHDTTATFTKTNFFCYNVQLVKAQKTWEEALKFCRNHMTDLVSVASQTEMMLIQKVLSKTIFTEYVWMGLRFLGDSWQWVDGQSFENKSWGQGGEPVCPIQRCVALQLIGKVYPNNLQTRMEIYAQDIKVYNSYTCDNKLFFICKFKPYENKTNS